tara:strand:- start:68 stop:289 length:222 start_codon:yes stop_codon:yes gene_type:complete
MGKVKQMMMDQEVEFWDKALSTIFQCERRIDFVSKMIEHFHLMRPMSDQEIYSELFDAWNEHQSNHAEENRDG